MEFCKGGKKEGLEFGKEPISILEFGELLVRSHYVRSVRRYFEGLLWVACMIGFLERPKYISLGEWWFCFFKKGPVLERRRKSTAVEQV